MPQETKSATPPETPEAFSQGFEIDGSDAAGLAEALDLALDYRGDVTVWIRGQEAPLEGFIFDRRRPGPESADGPSIRLMPKGSDDRVVVTDASIERLRVSGKDTAAGKSFDNWIKRYVEKRRAGEVASIESETLDDTAE